MAYFCEVKMTEEVTKCVSSWKDALFTVHRRFSQSHISSVEVFCFYLTLPTERNK